MKRLSLLLAALLACAALTVTAFAAGPSLTVNGDGKPSTTNEAEARTYLGAFEPNTGRFLGLASTKSALNRNTALKAIQLNTKDFTPRGAARSVLVITEPGSTVSGGTYDRVVVTRAVGTGVVTLSGVGAARGVTVWGGSSLALDNCAVSRVTVNTASLAITTSGMTGEIDVFAEYANDPSVIVNGAPVSVASMEEENGFGINFTIDTARQLKLQLTAPPEMEKDENQKRIFYTYCFCNASGDRTFFTNVTANQSRGMNISFAAGTYTRVKIFRTADGYDFDSIDPVAQWTLEHPVISSRGEEEFPFSNVTVTAAPDTSPGREGHYVYSFTGLDFNFYNYRLSNPQKRSGAFINGTPSPSSNLNSAGDWIGDGMELSAEYAVLENGAYHTNVTKAITVNVSCDTSSNAPDDIVVTSASGSPGAPKAGEMLKVTLPASAASGYVIVTTVVGGAATTVMTYSASPGATTTLPLMVSAGVIYQVAECSANGTVVSGGATGTGTGVQ